MKKLEELGISPAPWKFIPLDVIGADVKCSWKGIAMKRRHTMIVHDAYIADARLIAAAPEMYDALYDAVEEKCRVCDNHLEGLVCVKFGNCHVHKWRAALAEAAGESEE